MEDKVQKFLFNVKETIDARMTMTDTLQEAVDARKRMVGAIQENLKDLLDGKEAGYFFEFLAAQLLNNFKSGHMVDNNGKEIWTILEPGISNWRRLKNPASDHFLGKIEKILCRYKDEFLGHKNSEKLAEEIVEGVSGPSPLQRHSQLFKKQECVSNICGSTAKWAKAVVENSGRYADKYAAAAYLEEKMEREILEKNTLPIVYLKIQKAKILVAIGETEQAEALIKEVEEEADLDFAELCLESFKSTKELLKSATQ